MAPRMRLSLAKPLPTICETHEEVVEDSASAARRTGSPVASPAAGPVASTLASPELHSSDDYIQSICHLARPTFPGLPESSCKAQDRKTLKTPEARSLSPSLGRMQREASKCRSTNFISNTVPLGKLTPAEADFWSGEDPLAQIYTCGRKLCSSKESSYGKNSGTSCSRGSFSTPNGELHPPTSPRLPSPRPVQKEGFCSEMKCLRRDEGAVLGSNHSQKENSTVLTDGRELSPSSARGKLVGNPVLRCSARRQSCLFKTAGTEEEQGGETSHPKQRYSQCSQVPKKAMIHSWISEHRCIWKEAKIKACLLPAIAEV